MISSEAIERARRDVRAAQTLFQAGLLPECDAHLRAALRTALGAWSEAAPESAAEPVETDGLAALAQNGYPSVDRLRGVLVAERASNDVARRLPRDFEATWAETERLLRFSERRLLPAVVQKRRRRRMATALVLAVLLAIFVSERLWGRVRARASASYSPESPASYAIDGIDSTEWLLPDGTLGWLDLYLPRATDVRSVVVLNGHNRFYLDRGTQRVRVTAYKKDQELASAEGSFKGITDGHPTLKLPLHADGVTRVRLEVLSFFGSGSAVAEVEVH
ncbi:MAG TPA: discoidin domain-containing protein [Polyangiaceae bacterium]|nr:discoidin domain-containing protein [Polyangiaceae bacterium]